ncbi:dnaJ homolog subfamily C member 15-like isoform X2 [Pristis pectinata]|uniref:dnaJ homolog subfamily C member 15-like isoform X2 n=1 Tax=Pristis pectinata TaxID=685728 RepID=UPI00223DB5A4|nr:dnaJ homolog subfamily C member 15-like isoform X2 [Pristis pectinata]
MSSNEQQAVGSRAQLAEHRATSHKRRLMTVWLGTAQTPSINMPMTPLLVAESRLAMRRRTGVRQISWLSGITKQPHTQRQQDQGIDCGHQEGEGRTLIAVGLGITAAAFAGRHAFRLWKPLQQVIVETARTIPSPSFSAYYKGGFEAKMSKREASLILGVSPSANRTKIAEAHKRIMLLNHPDKGGSPFLAAKINEAKDLMDSSSKKIS